MRLDRETVRQYAANPALFRDMLFIEAADGKIIRFAKVCEGWQDESFARIDPILLAAAGRGPTPAAMKSWDERPRGHSKSSDAAACILWMLTFSGRPTHQVLVAKDSDQANLILKFLSRLIDLNALATFLKVQRELVVNVSGGPSAGSTVSVISSDWRGSFGLLVDALWCDELCHWPPGAEQMSHSVLTTADKRPNTALVVLTNAGTDRGTSWQWSQREIARTSEAWVFGHIEGCVASWISEKKLQQQRRALPRNVYLRLWQNEWVAGGDNGIDPQDIHAAITLPAKMYRPVEGWQYYIGADFGMTADNTAVVTIALNPTERRLKLIDVAAWKPRPGRPVDGAAVRRYLFELLKVFNPVCVRIDPWEARILIQDLKAAGYGQVEEFTFSSPTNRKELASALFTAFAEKIFDLYPDEDFIAELHKISFADKGSHYELSAARDLRGHCDRVYAAALALVPAIARMRYGEFDAGGSMARPASPLVNQLIQKAEPDPVAVQREGPLRRHGIMMSNPRWDRWNRMPYAVRPSRFPLIPFH